MQMPLKDKEGNFYFPGTILSQLLNLYSVRTTGVPKLKVWYVIVSDKKKFLVS